MPLRRYLLGLALGLQLTTPGGAAFAQETQPGAPNPTIPEPLHTQLKPDQPFCYGGDYDAAYLEQHPDQQTASIRISRGPAEIARYAATGKPKNWPEGANIAVAVKTRDNDEVQQAYTCSTQDNQWRCSSKASEDAACDMLTREVFLGRGAEGTLMLSNPGDGLPSLELCSRLDIQKTGDETFQLKPMPLSACGL